MGRGSTAGSRVSAPSTCPCERGRLGLRFHGETLPGPHAQRRPRSGREQQVGRWAGGGLDGGRACLLSQVRTPPGPPECCREAAGAADDSLGSESVTVLHGQRGPSFQNPEQVQQKVTPRQMQPADTKLSGPLARPRPARCPVCGGASLPSLNKTKSIRFATHC